MHHTTFAIALLLLVAPAAATDLVAVPETPLVDKGTTCAALQLGVVAETGTLVFADGFESGDTSAWGGFSMSAKQVLDLVVRAVFPAGWSGDDLLEIELVGPAGTLYERRSVPVSASAVRGTARKVASYPHPLVVAAVGAGEATPSARFPIAGTSIVASGLYGNWTAQARLQGAASPCWTPTSFRIAP